MLVVALSSLKYFWQVRSPDETARDVGAIARHYSRGTELPLVFLGYSFGADVIPFVVNRLPSALRERIRLIALLSPAHDSTFVVEYSWHSFHPTAYAVRPELLRLTAPTKCLYGHLEAAATICDEIRGSKFTRVELPGGHHYDGRYAAIADRILVGADVAYRVIPR